MDNPNNLRLCTPLMLTEQVFSPTRKYAPLQSKAASNKTISISTLYPDRCALRTVEPF